MNQNKLLASLQVNSLHKHFDLLQNQYGDKSLNAIYGAGKLQRPKSMFIFMNPTARNLASYQEWQGLRAPWLATKSIWDLFLATKLVSTEIYDQIKSKKPTEWTPEFSLTVYANLAENDVYITNLAKCTQLDARPLHNKVFKEYLYLMFKEIEIVKPKHIFAFGNQVSSILLSKNISVSNYSENQFEQLAIGNRKYNIYPTYYPVGQGRRNLDKSVKRINDITGQL